jgi:hypothetical protein
LKVDLGERGEGSAIGDSERAVGGKASTVVKTGATEVVGEAQEGGGAGRIGGGGRVGFEILDLLVGGFQCREEGRRPFGARVDDTVADGAARGDRVRERSGSWSGEATDA